MRSAERARELGEVFTDPREVDAILDQLQDVNYSSRYLEPGCGSGNFLVEILKRKFSEIEKLPEVRGGLKSGSANELSLKSLISVGSIYGIDISEVNIEESRERLGEVFTSEYLRISRAQTLPVDLKSGLDFVLSRNIILGNLLGNTSDIDIYEYSEVPGQKLKVQVFKFSELLYPDDEVFEEAPLLFGHVPQPHKVFPSTQFEKLGGLENGLS